jgi:hypothetical protein
VIFHRQVRSHLRSCSIGFCDLAQRLINLLLLLSRIPVDSQLQLKPFAPLWFGCPVLPSIFPPEDSSAALRDVFYRLQILPVLSRSTNTCGINQLSTLGEWVCEIAGLLVRCIAALTGKSYSGAHSPRAQPKT